MARMTIAQQREKAVYQLAQRKNPTPTEQDLQDARKTMNSFYRLCGLDEQLLYLENDERFHEKAAKRERWFERLNNVFKSEYNACLVYFGYCPTICESGTTKDLYLRHFYN